MWTSGKNISGIKHIKENIHHFNKNLFWSGLIFNKTNIKK